MTKCERASKQAAIGKHFFIYTDEKYGLINDRLTNRNLVRFFLLVGLPILLHIAEEKGKTGSGLNRNITSKNEKNEASQKITSFSAVIRGNQEIRSLNNSEKDDATLSRQNFKKTSLHQFEVPCNYTAPAKK